MLIIQFTATYGKSKPVEFRKLLQNSTNFIKDASKYYRDLIQRLIVYFRVTDLYFVLQTFKAEMPITDSNQIDVSKEVKDLVIRSCHASLIYLGDLSRYRELQAGHRDGKHDWGPALGYYQFARRLLPDAGVPMNQLAVVATYGGNVLASTYYFHRAICAVDPFPAARNNLAVAYKKILDKNKDEKGVELNSFIKVHANLSLDDKYVCTKKEQQELLSSVRNSITERTISGETLCQLVCVNFAALYLAMDVPTGEQKPARRKIETYRSLTLDFISLLLDILADEIVLVKLQNTDYTAQISGVTRRILPALRLCSRWIQLQLVDAKPVWDTYMRSMTLCGSKFQRNRLPQLTRPLDEDLDVRGFLPLQGGLNGSQLPANDTGAHPTEEMLLRLSDLLADAAQIASQIVWILRHILYLCTNIPGYGAQQESRRVSSSRHYSQGCRAANRTS